MQIRRLTPGDAGAFVALRRQALVLEPLAFSASAEDDRASDIGAVQAWLGDPGRAALFGAFAPALFGVVGIYRDERKKASHKAHLWGMYVAAAHRRAGAGRALMQAAIDHAQTLPGIVQVHLSVSEATPAARRLYEKLGFTKWGTEDAALCHEGRVVAEHHMILKL